MAGTPSLSLQVRDCLNECECLLRVVTVGSGELNSQWNSTPVANQMTLAAQFGPVGGIRSRLWPPKTARTEQLSTTARDQSIRPTRPSQSNSDKVNQIARYQTLANLAGFSNRSCLSRSPVPLATSPKESHCEGQTEYL